MLDLRVPTPPHWLDAVFSDFDAFLLDHANCERKASATALSFVSHYADRKELVDALVPLAVEELQHFAQVVAWLTKRGLALAPDGKDPYMGGLLKHVRTSRHHYFLDRLLLAGVVEARGCERFGLIAEALPAGELKDFYQEITRSEARHHGLFYRLARIYFPEDETQERLNTWLDVEAEILTRLPHRATLH